MECEIYFGVEKHVESLLCCRYKAQYFVNVFYHICSTVFG